MVVKIQDSLASQEDGLAAHATIRAAIAALSSLENKSAKSAAQATVAKDFFEGYEPAAELELLPSEMQLGIECGVLAVLRLLWAMLFPGLVPEVDIEKWCVNKLGRRILATTLLGFDEPGSSGGQVLAAAMKAPDTLLQLTSRLANASSSLQPLLASILATRHLRRD